MAANKPTTNEEIARQLITLTDEDLDRTMAIFAAILDAKRKANDGLPREAERGATALRLAANRWRIVPDRASKSEAQDTVAKLLAGE
jgi:hypothetical protein